MENEIRHPPPPSRISEISPFRKGGGYYNEGGVYLERRTTRPTPREHRRQPVRRSPSGYPRASAVGHTGSGWLLLDSWRCCRLMRGISCYSFSLPSQSISSLYSISASVFWTLLNFSSMSAMRFWRYLTCSLSLPHDSARAWRVPRTLAISAPCLLMFSLVSSLITGKSMP